MSAQRERRIDIASIEKEAEDIIEKAKRESEGILKGAHQEAEVMLSDVKADTVIPNDGMKGAEEKTSQMVNETIASTQRQLEELENKAKKNAPHVIQGIVKAVMGTQ